MYSFPRRPPPASGLARQADNASRRVRVSGLPEQTQEPLLQQALEKIIQKIVRVSITEESHEAVVELETPAVSCLLLDCPPIHIPYAVLN